MNRTSCDMKSSAICSSRDLSLFSGIFPKAKRVGGRAIHPSQTIYRSQLQQLADQGEIDAVFILFAVRTGLAGLLCTFAIHILIVLPQEHRRTFAERNLRWCVLWEKSGFLLLS